jgi:hypothetical protein
MVIFPNAIVMTIRKTGQFLDQSYGGKDYDH